MTGAERPMDEVDDTIRDVIRKQGERDLQITLIPETLARVGYPQGVETSEFACPDCGAFANIPIHCGMPTEEVVRKAKAGRVATRTRWPTASQIR